MAAMAASDGSSISCGSRDDKTSHMSPNKICSQSTNKIEDPKETDFSSCDVDKG